MHRLRQRVVKGTSTDRYKTNFYLLFFLDLRIYCMYVRNTLDSSVTFHYYYSSNVLFINDIMLDNRIALFPFSAERKKNIKKFVVFCIV